ncbi:hypothetical protein [Streptomyces sp. NBC_01244]|uniref:hypothetical protein n=1 Tax=Streptomyces sp. NBC_01244 TaxID=2903797 RepID=UPI003FA389C3
MDLVGHPSLRSSAADLLAPHGRLVLIGMGSQPITIPDETASTHCNTAFTAPGAPNPGISTCPSSSRQQNDSTCRGRSATSSL